MPTSAERAAARREARAAPPRPDPANDDTDLPSVSREGAAEWFKAQGIDVMTADRLRQDAAKRKGPPYFTVGRVPYYRLADLRAWLRQQQEGTQAA